MSFNFLPDELVAQMSSHLDYKDICNLLETQKRINRVLVDFKMDKPDVYELKVNYTFEPPRLSFVFKKYELDRAINMSFEKENALVSALSMFRSVKSLCLVWCALTDDVADSIMKYKFKNLVLIRTTLRLSAEKLVLLGKKFSKVTFYHCYDDQQHLNDNLLCQIVPSIKIHVNVLRKDLPALYELSDRLIDSMISGKLSKEFHADHDYTLFTVNGIRRFLENCVNKGHSFNASFGILNRNQLADALDWYRYIKEHRGLRYKIMEINREIREFCITSVSPRSTLIYKIARNVQ